MEWDKRLVEILEKMVLDSDNIQIIQTDALTYDYYLFFSKSPAPYIVMGNLPYYLATALIQKLPYRTERGAGIWYAQSHDRLL